MIIKIFVWADISRYYMHCFKAIPSAIPCNIYFWLYWHKTLKTQIHGKKGRLLIHWKPVTPISENILFWTTEIDEFIFDWDGWQISVFYVCYGVQYARNNGQKIWPKSNASAGRLTSNLLTYFVIWWTYIQIPLR